MTVEDLLVMLTVFAGINAFFSGVDVFVLRRRQRRRASLQPRRNSDAAPRLQVEPRSQPKARPLGVVERRGLVRVTVALDGSRHVQELFSSIDYTALGQGKVEAPTNTSVFYFSMEDIVDRRTFLANLNSRFGDLVTTNLGFGSVSMVVAAYSSSLVILVSALRLLQHNGLYPVDTFIDREALVFILPDAQVGLAARILSTGLLPGVELGKRSYEPTVQAEQFFDQPLAETSKPEPPRSHRK